MGSLIVDDLCGVSGGNSISRVGAGVEGLRPFFSAFPLLVGPFTTSTETTLGFLNSVGEGEGGRD